MTYEEAVSRCWVEVDISAIEKNYRLACQILGKGVETIPVLKANAYGMGIGTIAETLYNNGARFFAVAMANEAEQILARVKNAKVLTMGLCGRENAVRLIKAGQSLCVFSEKSAETVRRSAREAGTQARVQFKIDTGLHRIGFDPTTAAATIASIISEGDILAEGIFTHLGIHSPESDMEQIAQLECVRDELDAKGIKLSYVHAMDSIGMARYAGKGYRGNAARIGAWIYGVKPRADIAQLPVFCAKFKARVSQVRLVKKGELIGYDDDHPTKKDTMVATVSAGYIDGTARKAQGWVVELNGKLVPAIGIACMDQMMIDVTDLPDVCEGDIVTFVGGMIDNESYSKMCGFNHNESIARIGPRVPRVYLRNGEVVRIGTELIM